MDDHLGLESISESMQMWMIDFLFAFLSIHPHLHCKKIPGPKSSKEPTAPHYKVIDWIAVRGILVHIFSGRKSGDII